MDWFFVQQSAYAGALNENKHTMPFMDLPFGSYACTV
jgi:hypothetical protein